MGEEVDVIYERDTPQDALIDSFFQLYFISLITGFMGAIVAGIGIALWCVSNKDSSKELNHYRNISNFNP
jgi:energy-converting hydrogenase Eha subunit G